MQGKVQETVEVLERAALRNGKELPPGEIATSVSALSGLPAGLDDMTDSDDDADDYIPSAAEQDAPVKGGVQFPSVTAAPTRQKNYLKSLRTLFCGRYALSTNLLVWIWIIVALVYYGLVLLTTSLEVRLGARLMSCLLVGDFFFPSLGGWRRRSVGSAHVGIA